MKKKKGILILSGVFLLLLVFICFSNFSSAIVKPGVPFFNLSQKSFGPGQVLEGYFNLSLENQPSNIEVNGQVAGVEKKMDLLDYLNEVNAVFTCQPADCEIDFIASNPGSTKTMTLVEGSEVYYGFLVFGSQVQIQNLSFSMLGSSGAQPVCYETPFKFDLLDDDLIDFEYKESLDWCPQHASECFNPNYATQAGLIGTTPSCQKIWLNKTGKVNVTALISRPLYSEPGYNDIEFFITDLTGVLKGECTLELIGWQAPEENFGDVSCIVGETEYGESTDFYVEEAGYYYVCVRKSAGATVQYSIKKESQPDVCGFYAEPPSSIFTEDYAIYVKEAKFAPFNGEVYFNETSMLGNTPLITYIQNYIDSEYNGNCSGDGCVIPLKFISLATQEVTLMDPVLTYTPGPGYSPTSNNKFYNLVVDWPEVNMSLQQLPFNVLNLSAPEQPANYVVIVRIGTASGSAPFKVESVPVIQSVSPLIVIPGQNTEFRAVVVPPSGRQIIEYRWDFGDNTAEQVTTEPNITYAYNQIGNYMLTVKAKDDLGLQGSKSFSITSNITRELLNNTIQALRIRLDEFGSQVSGVEYWYRDMVSMNVTEINNTLDVLESQLNIATQTELIDIKNELDSLDIPLSITDTFILKDSLYYVNLDEIKPRYVSDLTQESYDPDLKTQYQNTITVWQEENLELKISGVAKALIYDDRIEDKITVVNIRMDPLVGISNAYVVFSLPPGTNYNNIRILSNADELSDLSDAVGFIYYDLASIETISIALPGKHDFSDIVFYVSPSLQDLGITTGPPPTPSEKPPYVLAVFLIVLIALVVFVALWFIWRGKTKGIGKKKLFKNPMDLYNIIGFIKSNQAARVPKKKIIEQLRKSSWSKKQIAYAFKKSKEQRPMFTTSTPRSRRPSSIRKKL